MSRSWSLDIATNIAVKSSAAVTECLWSANVVLRIFKHCDPAHHAYGETSCVFRYAVPISAMVCSILWRLSVVAFCGGDPTTLRFPSVSLEFLFFSHCQCFQSRNPLGVYGRIPARLTIIKGIIRLPTFCDHVWSQWSLGWCTYSYFLPLKSSKLHAAQGSRLPGIIESRRCILLERRTIGIRHQSLTGSTDFEYMYRTAGQDQLECLSNSKDCLLRKFNNWMQHCTAYHFWSCSRNAAYIAEMSVPEVYPAVSVDRVQDLPLNDLLGCKRSQFLVWVVAGHIWVRGPRMTSTFENKPRQKIIDDCCQLARLSKNLTRQCLFFRRSGHHYYHIVKVFGGRGVNLRSTHVATLTK